MKNKAIFSFLFFYVLVAIFTICYFDGTGDSGDSIFHYQHARYAPQHPHIFFNHWAKPLYVLLFSPWAQFGFIGVKIFNALIVFFTLFFTFKITEKLAIKNAILSPVLLLFSPLFYILTFSGLTEPLFALMLSIGIYAILKDKYTFAAILISFLPFVRSEGLLIAAVFGLFFLLKKRWQVLPWLTAGHIVYSIAGSFVHENLLWVFKKIPYDKLSSLYGNGGLTDFIIKMNYVVGVPIYALFWIGVISIIWKSIKQKLKLELQILVFIGFFVFFIAHSLFWYLGIFNSMGLKRVLISVLPLSAIIALMGFNWITEDLLSYKKTLKLFFQSILILLVLIFPFTPNPAAINWSKDMQLISDQVEAIQVVKAVKDKLGDNNRFIYVHPYLSEVLQIDHFDYKKHIPFRKNYLDEVRSGDIIIWEAWFSVIEFGITQKSLDKNSQLENIYRSSSKTKASGISFAAYRVK